MFGKIAWKLPCNGTQDMKQVLQNVIFKCWPYFTQICKTNTALKVLFITIYSGLCQLQCCKCFCWKATVQQRHEYRTWFCTSVSIRYCKTDIKHAETKVILGFSMYCSS